MAERMLDIQSLDVVYGDFQATFGIDLHVDTAETVSIIGANGAGKSTLLKAICGLANVRSGSITYQGADLASVPVHTRVANGIAMVPEGRRLIRCEAGRIGRYMERIRRRSRGNSQ